MANDSGLTKKLINLYLRMFVYKPVEAFMVLARSSVEKFEESTLLNNSYMDE